jgi:hypothetical protein
VHLDGAGLAQHPDQRPLGVAAHDRVVDTDDRLPRTTSRSGLSLSRMPSWRIVCEGWMKVRPDVRVLGEPALYGMPEASRSRSRPGCRTPAPG